MASVHLFLLGGARIEADGTPVTGRAAQRRRVGLLALLALAPRRTLGRERVIGYLWPDHPPDGARHLLSESLYVIRRALGEGALLGRGDELTLGEGVTSDVESFLSSVEAGELEQAIAIYRGPLLDGWYVRDATELEHWVETERGRIALLHAQALRQLAIGRENANDWPGAAELWRELLRVDPYSSIAAWHAARALAHTGERAAALQTITAHEALLEADLGVGLGDDLATLASRIRAGADLRPPGSEQQGAAMRTTAPSALAGESDPPMMTDAPSHPSPLPTRSHRTGRWLLAAAVLLVFGMAVGWGQLGDELFPTQMDHLDARPPSGPDAQVMDANRVAVLYFEDRSLTGELGYLCEGLTEGLIRELTGLRALRVLSEDAVRPARDRTVRLDSLAQALGAGTIVTGNLRMEGSDVRVSVHMLDGATGDQIAADVFTRPQGEPLAIADELAARVAAALRRRLGEHLGERRGGREVGLTENGDQALELLLRAEWLRRQAALARLGDADSPSPDSARSLLHTADSILAKAERLAPAWPRPALERGWVAVTAGRLEHGPARVVALAPGLAHAERALTLLRIHAPTDSVATAVALHLRGELRVRTATAVQTYRPEASILRAGTDDLRAAVTANPALAGAWATLAMAEWVNANFDEAEAAAERAIGEDAYLVEAPDVIGWAWRSAAAMGRRDDAESWCRRGRQMIPGDWHFVECELSLMRLDAVGITGRSPDPARAAAIVADLERMDPPSRAAEAGHPYSPHYRRLVHAAVLASAGMRDSATSILISTLATLRDDPELSTDVLYDSALLRFLLADPAGAERDLASYLRARPDLERLLARDRVIEAARASIGSVTHAMYPGTTDR